MFSPGLASAALARQQGMNGTVCFAYNSAANRHSFMAHCANAHAMSQVCIGEYLDGCAEGSAACPCCQRPLSVDLTAAAPVRSLT